MLDALLDLAAKGCADLTAIQQRGARPARARDQVFLASRNPKKLDELRRILGRRRPDIEVVGLDDVSPYDEPAETEPTFEGNALIKARAGLQATGLPTLADDSGLCVDALNGMPGVLSARWAGLAKDDAANNRLLLEQLHDVPDERRGAEFRCAVAFCRPGGAEDGRVRRDARRDHPREPRGAAASATTAVRARRRDAHQRRDAGRREGRDLAPRQGAARCRAARRQPRVQRPYDAPGVVPEAGTRTPHVRSAGTGS